jgi:hypothetical protein
MKPIGGYIKGIASLQDDFVALGIGAKAVRESIGIPRGPIKVRVTSRRMGAVIERHVATLIGVGLKGKVDEHRTLQRSHLRTSFESLTKMYLDNPKPEQDFW